MINRIAITAAPTLIPAFAVIGKATGFVMTFEAVDGAVGELAPTVSVLTAKEGFVEVVVVVAVTLNGVVITKEGLVEIVVFVDMGSVVGCTSS